MFIKCYRLPHFIWFVRVLVNVGFEKCLTFTYAGKNQMVRNYILRSAQLRMFFGTSYDTDFYFKHIPQINSIISYLHLFGIAALPDVTRGK